MNRWGFNRCNFSSVFNPGDYTVREGICALERGDLGRWVEWEERRGGVGGRWTKNRAVIEPERDASS